MGFSFHFIALYMQWRGVSGKAHNVICNKLINNIRYWELKELICVITQ